MSFIVQLLNGYYLKIFFIIKNICYYLIHIYIIHKYIYNFIIFEIFLIRTLYYIFIMNIIFSLF